MVLSSNVRGSRSVPATLAVSCELVPGEPDWPLWMVLRWRVKTEWHKPGLDSASLVVSGCERILGVETETKHAKCMLFCGLCVRNCWKLRA